MDRMYDIIRIVGFFHEAGIVRQVRGTYLAMPRGNNDLHGRPSVSIALASFNRRRHGLDVSFSDLQRLDGPISKTPNLTVEDRVLKVSRISPAMLFFPVIVV